MRPFERFNGLDLTREQESALFQKTRINFSLEFGIEGKRLVFIAIENMMVKHFFESLQSVHFLMCALLLRAK